MYKIVVTANKTKKTPRYEVAVFDGDNNEVFSEVTKTPLERSNLVNAMKEMYDTDDIKYVGFTKAGKGRQNMKKPKLSKVPTVEFIMPEEIDRYFDINPHLMFDRILVAVEEGLTLNKRIVKLFDLNKSGNYITSQRADWLTGLEKAQEWYVLESHFEKAQKCKQLIELYSSIEKNGSK